MKKAHLYIFQIVSILLLVLGYLISDVPDSLSVMHFNSETPESFNSVTTYPKNNNISIICTSSANQKQGKVTSIKYFSCEAIIPPIINTNFNISYYKLQSSPTIKEEYQYLFFGEINPPPPKKTA